MVGGNIGDYERVINNGVVVHQARTSALQAEGSGFETHLLHSDFHCFHNVNGLARGSNLAHCFLVQWLRIVPLQGKGHRFDSYRSNNGDIAQW